MDWIFIRLCVKNFHVNLKIKSFHVHHFEDIIFFEKFGIDIFKIDFCAVLILLLIE